MLDVVVVDVDVAGRGRQPLCPSNSWIALRSMPRAYSDEAQKCRSACGVSRPPRPAATGSTASASPSAARSSPTRVQRPVCRSRRSLGSIGASGSDQSSPNWWRTSVSHQSDQRVHRVDRRDQPGLRAAAPAALAEADMQLAELAQIGTPVPDVQHRRLADPQPDPPPQRRRQVVPGRRQVLARPGSAAPPRAEQRVDLRLRRRHPRRAVVGLGRAVELIDRLDHHVAGQRVDVALVAGDQEVEEPRQRPRLVLHRGRGLAARPAQPGQEPVSVLRLGGPHRPAEEPRRTRRSPPGPADDVPSETPAAAIASAYWSTSSCSKSSSSAGDCSRRAVPRDLTTASVTGVSVHPEPPSGMNTTERSGIQKK